MQKYNNYELLMYELRALLHKYTNYDSKTASFCSF